MPQELNVLSCYNCKFFQVHIVKKAKQWQCKICNEKQSFQQIYFQGSGKDCRTYVQKANTLIQSQIDTSVSFNENNYESIRQGQSSDTFNSESEVVESKWTKYLDPPVESVQSGDTDSVSYDCSSESLNMSDSNSDCMMDESVSNISIEENADSVQIDDDAGKKDKLNTVEKSKSIFENDAEIDFSIDF